MAKTDGYITDTSSGDWRYSNTGQGSRGDVTGVDGDAYARFERQAGAIAGTRVDATGTVSAGPVIDFKTLDAVLAGAPAVPGAPNVVWAGVSPLSLSEVLIVWNQSVVILDKAKILGGDKISVAGRLMIVSLGSPIAIDGEEQATIVFQPGAVGVYGDEGPICDVEGQPTNITTGTGGGSLSGLPGPTAPCGCGSPITGGAGSATASGTGAQVVDARLFAEQLCQDGGCDPVEELVEGTMSFTVNNQLSVPVRCCHPFYLKKLAVHGDSGSCPCVPCPVWLASLIVYGSTLPGEVLPLDQLFDIPNPCQMWDLLSSGALPAILTTDCSCCAGIAVTIVGNFGPAAVVNGKWAGELPGLAGQSVSIKFKMEKDCSGALCATNVYPDATADPWVEEGILKPRHRALPVAFFTPLKLTTDEFDLPKNMTTVEQTVISTCPGVTLAHEVIQSFNAIDDAVAVAMPTTAAKWFNTCTGTNIDVCPAGGGPITPLFVLTNCEDSGTVSPTNIKQVLRGFDKSVLLSPTDQFVVTECDGALRNLVVAAGPVVNVRILKIDPDGQIVIPKVTDPACSVTWKFVMHDGIPQQWTQIIRDNVVPCGPDLGCVVGRDCAFTTPIMPNEIACAGVNLTTPIWVSQSEAPGDGGCPGYDCSPENPNAPPAGSNHPNGPGAPVSCGILIRRPQRRPFRRCH